MYYRRVEGDVLDGTFRGYEHLSPHLNNYLYMTVHYRRVQGGVLDGAVRVHDRLSPRLNNYYT